LDLPCDQRNDLKRARRVQPRLSLTIIQHASAQLQRQSREILTPGHAGPMPRMHNFFPSSELLTRVVFPVRSYPQRDLPRGKLTDLVPGFLSHPRMLLCAALKLANYGLLRHTCVTQLSACMRMAYRRRTPVLAFRHARKVALDMRPPVSCSRCWFWRSPFLLNST
jgi:hypothetical protein